MATHNKNLITVFEKAASFAAYTIVLITTGYADFATALHV